MQLAATSSLRIVDPIVLLSYAIKYPRSTYWMYKQIVSRGSIPGEPIKLVPENQGFPFTLNCIRLSWKKSKSSLISSEHYTGNHGVEMI